MADDGYNSDVEGGLVGGFRNFYNRMVDGNHRYGVFAGFGNWLCCCVPFSVLEILKAIFAALTAGFIYVLLIVILILLILDYYEDKDQSDKLDEIICKLNTLQDTVNTGFGISS